MIGTAEFEFLSPDQDAASNQRTVLEQGVSIHWLLFTSTIAGAIDRTGSFALEEDPDPSGVHPRGCGGA